MKKILIPLMSILLLFIYTNVAYSLEITNINENIQSYDITNKIEVFEDKTNTLTL